MTSISDRISARARSTRTTLAQPNLRRLLLAYGGFNLAEWATWIAALVYAFGAGGATAAGLIAFIQLVPAATAAPFVALLGDRSPRERVLVGGYLAQSIAMVATGAAMVAGAPVPLVYALAAAAATSITVTRPTHGALLPGLSSTPEELTASNAASSIVEGAAVFAGPAIAGVLLGASEPGVVFLAMGGSVMGSALLASRLRPDADSLPVTGPVHGLVKEAVDGFRILGADRGATLLVALGGIQAIVWGTLDVMIVVIALDILGLGRSGVGYFNSALGLGGLVGAIAAFALVGRRRLTPAVLFGILLWGVPIVLIGFTSIPLGVAVLLAFAGGGRVFMDVAGRTLLQRAMPDDVLTRVLGVMEGSLMGGFAIGSILAPALVATLGARGATVASGALLPVVGVLAWPRLAQIDRSAEVHEDEIAALRASVIFAPLSALAIERLAADLVALSYPARATVIRQGDVGDRYYLVRSGTLGVAIDDRPAGELGPGDGFGEIALLRDVPRTATVVARTDVQLYGLDRDRFLEVVAGHPRSLEAADLEQLRRQADIHRQR